LPPPASTLIPPPFKFAVTKSRLLSPLKRPVTTKYGFPATATLPPTVNDPSGRLVGATLNDVAATATLLLRFSNTKSLTFVTAKLRTNATLSGLLARSVRLVRAVKRYWPGRSGPSLTRYEALNPMA